MSPYRKPAGSDKEETIRPAYGRALRIFGNLAGAFFLGFLSWPYLVSTSSVREELRERIAVEEDASEAEARAELTALQDDALCRRQYSSNYVGHSSCSWGGTWDRVWSFPNRDVPEGFRICTCLSDRGFWGEPHMEDRRVLAHSTD